MLFKIVFWCVFFLSGLTGSVYAAPNVVVSTAPLHSIVSAVADGVFEPELLLAPAVSVHDFQLKPSDMRKLSGADVVFWGGPDLETGLVKALRAAGKEESAVPVMSDPRMTLYRTRGEGRHHGIDGHFWLMPENMAVVAEIAAEKLAESDSENAETYRRNAGRVRQMTSELKAFGMQMLKKHKNKPYVTFHDAYQYFEKSFELPAVGFLAADPHHAGGAAGMAGIREKIKKSGTVCVFSEPQFPDKKVKAAAEGLAVVAGQADPVGSSVAAGKDFYKNLMTDLFRSFDACFQQLTEESK